MTALPDHRGGRIRGLAARLGGIAPAASASIVRSRLFIKYVALLVAVVSLALVANGAFDVYFSYQEQKASLVRLHRERRRERLRLLTLEIPVSAVDAAIARGFIKHEDSNLAWSVIDSVYRTQLSDTALDWLTDNAVITTEQRTNVAAILRCISNWVEQAAAR